jgi:hypothetical protein
MPQNARALIPARPHAAADSICKTQSVAASLVVLFCTLIPLTTHPSQNNFASANRLGERGQGKLFIHMGETECAGQ